MNTQEMAAKLREIKEYQHIIDEATAEMESLKDEVKATMTAQGVDTMTVDIFKVSYKTVVSSRFDTAAFQATHADLYKQYTKTTESKRFSIA